MARVRYNLDQRVFVYDCYVKKKKTHTNPAGENFNRKFPDTTHPSGDTISKLVKKVKKSQYFN
jgi:hypothetical protein